MPRIRKKTSNRQNTRDRAKINKKVAEHRKKSRRDSKRDVTWKSKKKAELGVPNNFPYKDRVLAEMAEEKRRNEEAKQARREANKRKEEEDEDTPGVISLTSGVLSASAPVAAAEGELNGDEADVPELVDTALATLQDAMDKSDVIVQVVDARDIQGGRSAWIQNLVEDSGGKYALLVNKIDLVPRENLNSWVQHLPRQTYLFSTNPPVSDPSSSTRPGKTEFLAALSQWATEKKDGNLTVALMGLPNTGKTSVLNTLLGSTKYAVAPLVPTAAAAKNPQPTTVKPVEVTLSVEGKTVAVIDTPGWEFIEDEVDEAEEEENMDEEKWNQMEQRVVGDLLRRNLGRIDRIKDVFPLVNYIVKRSNAQDLMLAYNIPYFRDGDVDAFLLALARANGRIRKHGDADLDSAARIVLRDWAHNTFPYYSAPPTSAKTTERTDLDGVLSLCRTRKELRATGKGVVRFAGGDIDTRDVIVDDNYIEMLQGSDDDEDEVEEEDEEEDEEDEDAEEEDEDEDVQDALVIGADEGEELDLEDGPEPSSGSDVEDDEDDEEEDEEEEEEERSPSPPPMVTQKRKRKSDAAVVPPKKAKRVSFGKNDIRVLEDTRPVKGNKRKRR